MHMHPLNCRTLLILMNSLPTVFSGGVVNVYIYIYNVDVLCDVYMICKMLS